MGKARGYEAVKAAVSGEYAPSKYAGNGIGGLKDGTNSSDSSMAEAGKKEPTD